MDFIAITTIASVILSVGLVVITLSRKVDSDFIDIECRLNEELRRVKDDNDVLRRQFDLVMDSYMDAEKRIRELENVVNEKRVANV